MAQYEKHCEYPECSVVFTTTQIRARYCVPHRKIVRLERAKESQKRRGHPERHLSKKDGVQVFEEANVRPLFLQERLYDLALSAAFAQKREPNATYFDELLIADDVEVPGELISLRVLYALWKTSPLKYERGWTFKKFLYERRQCKRDAVYLGRKLGKNFQVEPHGDWSSFLPSFNPMSLKPNYTQEDMRKWLRMQLSRTQGFMHDYLLMCARNHYKSTYIRIWAMTGILCCPDVRFLMCSKTQPIIKDWFDEFRPYWELGSGPQNEEFHFLFPDYWVKPEESKSYVFKSPMAHLNLAQKTAQLTSVDSGSTGSRFDILIADDVVDQDNTDQETQRKKVIRRYDAIWKLREVGGITITIGTPQHPEDLYAELKKRIEQGQPIAMHLSPAWNIINPEIERRMELPKGHPEFFDLHNIKFEDVVLMFPLRNFRAEDTFLWLMGELGKTPDQERDFRCQYLIQWVADGKEDTLNFDETKLRAAIILRPALPEGDTVLCLDTAYSASKTADNSALSAIRLARNTDGVFSIFVIDQDAGKWNVEKRAERVADFWQRYDPRIVWAEKSVDYDQVDRWLGLQAQRRGIGRIPIFWLPVDNAKAAKFKRVKACEALLPDRLKFVSGNYTEPLIEEALRLDGKTSTMTSRNDRWDTIALAARIWKIELAQYQPTNEVDLQKVRDQQVDEAWRKMEYDLHFSRIAPTAPILAPPVEPGPVDTRRAPLVDAGKRILGPGFRI